MFKFDLGDQVECLITGFKGVVVAKTEWFNGCISYNVKPPLSKDGEMQEAIGLDEPQLRLMKAKKVVPPKKEEKQHGGPTRKALRGS